jgi:peptidoglycan/xylan/chitin deacetylase (PgdA/CDA1 family)
MTIPNACKTVRNCRKMRRLLRLTMVYRDAYEIAFPVLKKFNAPATFFVITDFVDRKCGFGPTKCVLSLSYESGQIND